MPYSTLPIDIVSQAAPGTLIGTSEQFVEALINSSWLSGLDLKDEAKAAVSDALNTYLSGLAKPTMTAASLTPTTVDEPFVTIPADASVTNVFDTFTTEYIELATWLDAQWDLIISQFFPDDAAVYSAAEDWIQAAIGNLNAGLPPAVAAQMLADDSQRILAEAERAEEEMLATYASRGMSLPPGGAANASLQIQMKALDNTAESSRKIAIASLESMKWAVDKAIGLRDLAIKSATEYVKALTSAPDMISRMTNIGYDAQQKLILSAAAYYNARTAAKELTFKGTAANAEFTQSRNVENLRSELAIVAETTRALIVQVNSLTGMASSMFNNLHVSANASATDIISLAK